MANFLKSKKLQRVALFFIAFNLIWLLVWGINFFTETLPTNVHNPFIGLFSPYIALLLLPAFDEYNVSQWWSDIELMRPAIIFWLVAIIGSFIVYRCTK